MTPDTAFLSQSVLALVAGVAPLTIALVQVCKGTNLIASRFAGLLAIAFGIGLAFVFSNLASPLMTFGAGIVAGLTAAGAFSAVDAATKPKYEYPLDAQ